MFPLINNSTKKCVGIIYFFKEVKVAIKSDENIEVNWFEATNVINTDNTFEYR